MHEVMPCEGVFIYLSGRRHQGEQGSDQSDTHFGDPPKHHYRILRRRLFAHTHSHHMHSSRAGSKGVHVSVPSEVMHGKLTGV